ncbi:hypothetical protein [uncultured Clostridium sp.]|jgi:hypothetical protein|uniref:hypothetical protein n=1 Tax=uncultured Clostridium sp. TaxID=59620 RepID=UPI00262E52A1|nr:hypothetical protein [uncultured Clostridium sp.]
MDYIYGYADDPKEIRGTCTCGFKLESLLETNVTNEIITKCPLCNRAIKIKAIDLVLNLRGLKDIKNKLEKRCISIILDICVYQILDNYIEIFPDEINVSINIKSFSNFELNFNNTHKFYVNINSLYLISAFHKFDVNFTITSESDSSFELNIKDFIYY